MFIPNPEPYFDVYVDHGQYIGYGNLVGITKVPNKGFREIQPMNGNDAKLPKYKYSYGAPIHIINKICEDNPITADNQLADVRMIKLHDWREMETVKKVRQGDTFAHIWHNHNLLRKPITNIMMQQNYYVQGSMVAEPSIMTSSITGGISTAWDTGLNVSTAPRYGTLAKEGESNLEHEKARKRMRS